MYTDQRDGSLNWQLLETITTLRSHAVVDVFAARKHNIMLPFQGGYTTVAHGSH